MVLMNVPPPPPHVIIAALWSKESNNCGQKNEISTFRKCRQTLT